MTFDEIMAVYNGSSGDATKAMYARLMTFAPRGPVAVKLLQACKASERAKTYSRRYAAAAYDKKDWAISELCRALAVAFPDVIESWGWGFDPKAIGFEHVLYIDVPGAGQVSFHTSYRKDGPDYAGAWDGIKGVAPRRISRWAEAILNDTELTTERGECDGVHTGTERVSPQGAEEKQGVEAKQEAFHFGPSQQNRQDQADGEARRETRSIDAYKI